MPKMTCVFDDLSLLIYARKSFYLDSKEINDSAGLTTVLMDAIPFYTILSQNKQFNSST